MKMNLVVKIIIGVVAAIGIGIGAVFWFTSGMTDTADAFFASIKTKNYDKAYSYLAEQFRTNTSQAELEAFLARTALDNYKEASWSGRSISGGRGELNGEVKTETGGSIPLKLSFVKENSQWKIFAINKPRAGLSERENNMPTEAELLALTKEGMLKFSESVNAKDFSAFHAHIAKIWQKEWTVQRFNETFKQFIDANINMTPVIQRHTPSFDQAPEIKNNILFVKGHYPTRPSQIQFELKYIYEGLSWKLIGTKVDIVPVKA